MATIRTWKELEKALMQVRDKALEGTGEKTKELVKDRIDTDVYKVKPSPSEYIRTYELRESVEPSKVKSNSRTAELEVGHNTSKIRSIEPNQHYSVVDKSSSVESIAEIVHDGKSGKIFGEGYWTEPRPYMDNAQQEMEDGKYKEFMLEELKKMGIDAK